MKNFWLKFALQEALALLTAFGSAADPQVAAEIQAAAAAIQALLAKL
jgi:hypothetical protein